MMKIEGEGAPRMLASVVPLSVSLFLCARILRILIGLRARPCQHCHIYGGQKGIRRQADFGF